MGPVMGAIVLQQRMAALEVGAGRLESEAEWEHALVAIAPLRQPFALAGKRAP